MKNDENTTTTANDKYVLKCVRSLVVDGDTTITSENSLADRVGEKLGQVSASKQLVRAALVKLTAEGLVDTKPKKGTCVIQPSVAITEEAKDILAMFTSEQMIGKLSSPRKFNLDQVKASLVSMREKLEQADYDRYEHPRKANNLILDTLSELLDVLTASSLKNDFSQQCFAKIRLGEKLYDRDISSIPGNMESLVGALESEGPARTVMATEALKQLMAPS